MAQIVTSLNSGDIDLLPDQAVWNRVEEAVDLDVIIERDTGHAPFRELVVSIRQRRQDRHLDGLEQMSAADAKPAHDVRVDALQRGGTPPKKRNMRTWASIQSASFCVQVASA
jgi:hypothetical protein